MRHIVVVLPHALLDERTCCLYRVLVKEGKWVQRAHKQLGKLDLEWRWCSLCKQGLKIEHLYCPYGKPAICYICTALLHSPAAPSTAIPRIMTVPWE